MKKWFLVPLIIWLSSCSDSGVTFLTCVVGDQTSKPWRFQLDENHATFNVKTGNLPSMSGKAQFMAEEIRLMGNHGQATFFINRKDLTWGQFGGPPAGQCVKSEAPARQL